MTQTNTVKRVKGKLLLEMNLEFCKKKLYTLSGEYTFVNAMKLLKFKGVVAITPKLKIPIYINNFNDDFDIIFQSSDNIY